MTEEEQKAGIAGMDAKIRECREELAVLNANPGKPNERLRIERVEKELETALEHRRRLGGR